MTPHDRKLFKKTHGYEPCFKAWGPGERDLPTPRICIKAKEHDGPCLASIGVEKNWYDIKTRI